MLIDPQYKTSSPHLPTANLNFLGKRSPEVIAELKNKGIKVRHIDITMPWTEMHAPGSQVKADFETLFREARNIVLPNGKIFVTSNDKQFLEKIKAMAGEKGLRYHPKGIAMLPREQLLKHGFRNMPLTESMKTALNYQPELYFIQIIVPQNRTMEK